MGLFLLDYVVIFHVLSSVRQAPYGLFTSVDLHQCLPHNENREIRQRIFICFEGLKIPFVPKLQTNVRDRPPMDSRLSQEQSKSDQHSTEHRKRIIDRKKENNSELMLMLLNSMSLFCFLSCRCGVIKGNILVYCKVIRVGDDLKISWPPIESSDTIESPKKPQLLHSDDWSHKIGWFHKFINWAVYRSVALQTTTIFRVFNI